MNKKLVISLSVILGIILTIIILCFTVFTVKSIDIDFRTSTKENWEESEMIENSQIPYGKCLLFMSTSIFTKNLEEKYPYIQIINIEKVFPSKLVIHVAEREELFAIEKDAKTAILDKDFKVLKTYDGNYESKKTNAILLKNLNFTNELVLSNFLQIEETGLKRFYSSMQENNKSLGQALGFIKEIDVETNFNPLTNKTEQDMTICTFGQRKIKILDIDSYLSKKFQRMFWTLPMMYEELVDNGDYTVEEVDRCEILIGNQITDQSEIYVHIYLDGEVITSKTKS